MDIIGWLIVGLVAGALARLLVPGKDPMGVLGTLVLGLVGSIVGGLLGRMIFDDTSVGIVGSVIGAVIVLLVYRSVTGRKHSGTTA